jgi:hypothetical protein
VFEPFTISNPEWEEELVGTKQAGNLIC